MDELITGWVVLALHIDEFGRVDNARVTSSTSSRLEESALEAARRFRYQRELSDNRFVAVMDVSATVFFHYWSLAEAAGCSTNYE
ncbi:MAG: TonB family protein [Woeseia sp.]